MRRIYVGVALFVLVAAVAVFALSSAGDGSKSSGNSTDAAFAANMTARSAQQWRDAWYGSSKSQTDMGG